MFACPVRRPLTRSPPLPHWSESNLRPATLNGNKPLRKAIIIIMMMMRRRWAGGPVYKEREEDKAVEKPTKPLVCFVN